MTTTTNDSKDRLILHYADQTITALDHAAEVRRILNDATWAQAQERFDALIASNGGPVVRRGSREWHYATPSHPLKWAHPGSAYPAPDPISVYAVVASDGSQIFPDQSSRYPWAIIRIVTFCLKYGTTGFNERAHAREIEAIVTADDDDELFHILIADLTPQERYAKISGLRNRVEIRQAASVADFPYAPGPKVVMTDGPIHLFEPEDNDSVIIHARALQSALDVGAIPVGVIAGGEARYTVRLAGLLGNIDDRIWPGVTDFDVWKGALDHGERSPLFGIASSYNYAQFSVPVAFFYLKTGGTVLRVEVPASLTNEQIRQVTQVVLAESQGLEYPYALWKAHDRAVLRGGERAAFTAGWSKTLSRYGLEDSPSAKQRLKDLG